MYDDQYLINKIRGGNYAAYGLLINKYQSLVFSVLIKLVKNREEAEEALQDTFMKAYRSLDTFDPKARFSAWIYRIAYNTGLDYLKRRKRHIALEDHEPLQQADVVSDQEQQDLKTLIDDLISRLPAEDAAILTLFYFDQMTIREMKEITGSTESYLKTRLFRARAKLREMIPENRIDELKSYYHE